MTDQNVAPGWYPDNAIPGLLRYWDGAAWTAQTAPMPGAQYGPQPWGAPAGGGFAREAPSNGFGVAALVLGTVGIVLGVVPFVFGVAGVLGVVGVVLGIIGWRRAGRGQASNGGVAMAGIVTSAIAIVASVIWTLVLFIGIAVSTTESSDGVAGFVDGDHSASCAGSTYSQPQPNDVCVEPGQTVELGDLIVTAGPIVVSDATKDRLLCSTVTIENESDEPRIYDVDEFRIQTPGGVAEDSAVSPASPLETGDLDPGASTSGRVCTDDTGTRGQFVLIFGPDHVMSERGVWLGTVE